MVSFRDSIADDLSIVLDNIEAITVSLKRNRPEEISIATANRGPVNRKVHQQSMVQIEDDDVGFVFQANQFNPTLNTPQIRHHDEITDADGIVYIVQSAQLTVMQTVWNLATRKKTRP